LGDPVEIQKYHFTVDNLHRFTVSEEFDYAFLDLKNQRNLELLATSDDIVVIYPEVIDGNPCGVKNVVRWLLHDPGRITGRVYFGTRELYFPYSDLTEHVQIPQSKTSCNKIFIQHTPFKLFLDAEPLETRFKSAYCLRKGTGRTIVHDTRDSICIDHLSQRDVARVFKSVEFFYSYDTRTLYSQLAAIAGCKSIIIPDPNFDRHNRDLLYGVAYGEDDLLRAEITKPKLLQQLKDQDEASVTKANEMVQEIEEFFGINE
jgi:hypothetical protein